MICAVDSDRIGRMQAAGGWNRAGAELARIAVALEHAGAELLGEGNVMAPVFDTTLIHADAALEAALAG